MTNYEQIKSDINAMASLIANIVDSPRIACKTFCNYRNGGVCRDNCHKAAMEWLKKEEDQV